MADEAPRAQKFQYAKPQFERGKKLVRLAQTERILAAVQVLKSGGENNMHSHKSLDGFWMVLKGRARFYEQGEGGQGERILAELGPMEGVLIPKNFAYWFEAVEGEDLELLQVEAAHIPMRTVKELVDDRVDFARRTAAAAAAIEQAELLGVKS